MECSCAEVGCGISNGAEGGQVDYHCPIGAGRGSRLPLGTRGTSLILTDWSPNQTPALIAGYTVDAVFDCYDFFTHMTQNHAISFFRYCLMSL